MLRWISIFGGLLIMMRQHSRSEALFYYFRLDQVPENHLLRLIDKHISFEFVRERLRTSYSESGRPSIDPELLLRGWSIFLLSAHALQQYYCCAGCSAVPAPITS
jgi:hypothetical protein